MANVAAGHSGSRGEAGGLQARAGSAAKGSDAAARDVLLRRVRWRPSVRIVPSRFPPVNLFERVAASADWAAVIAVESLTNERLREESGNVRHVADTDRVSGPGASYIMAAFTHVPPSGGRFTDGTYGAWYAAKTRETAIHETIYHRQRFLEATSEPPIDLEMRVLEADLDGTLHDIRGLRGELPAIYDRGDYAASQAFARDLRSAGSNGIAYDSVRHEGGQCVAVFRPRLLRRAKQGEHLLYRWNGERIADVLRLTHRMG